jgi:hypothetical protein
MKNADITKEQSFFAVFCIENLADELKIPGDKVYKMLTEDSDLFDNYIIKHYEPLHTQGREYIVRELKEIMREQGLLK